MLKKWAVRILRGIIVLFLLLVLLDVGVHVVSRTEWFRARVTRALQNALGRDIKLARMGANLRGIFVEDLAVAQQGGFENGTFIEAGHLRVNFSLLPLLRGHTKVNLVLLSNVTVKATVFEDGRNSWQDLLAQEKAMDPQTEPSGKFPFQITANHLRLENARLIYEDKTAPYTLDINGLTIGVNHFSLAGPFSGYVQAKLHPVMKGKQTELLFGLRVKADLKELDFEQAYADIQACSVAYQDATLSLKGRIENFVKPQIKLTAVLRNLSSEELKEWVDLPAFKLSKATVSLNSVADLQASALTFHTVKLEAPGVNIQTHGGLLYGNTQAVEYDFSTEGTLVLGEAGRWFTVLAEPYRLVGTVQANAHTTHQQISGDINLTQAGGLVPQMGYLSSVNARAAFQGQTDFKTARADVDIKGKLNGRPAEVSAKADLQPALLDVTARLKADEIVLSSSSKQQTPQAENTDKQPAGPAAKWPLPPVQVKADVSVGKLDVPYFYGNDILFTADMQGLEPGFKQAHGSLHLSTGSGKIQDLYKLTNANPLTKVLFLSLDVVGKVFNSLNVLGVLNSIGGGVVSALTADDNGDAVTYTQTVLGPDGEPVEIPVEKTEKNAEGELAYDKFDTTIHFNQGRATVKNGSFVSPMMSLRLDGTTDFNTQQVDLTVHAAPGRHEADGMMPLTLTIGGTIDEPQGNMSMLGSVASLVTQSVTNNVVSRQVGKGVKGIWNFFKKKDTEETETLAPKADEQSGTQEAENTPASAP